MPAIAPLIAIGFLIYVFGSNPSYYLQIVAAIVAAIFGVVAVLIWIFARQERSTAKAMETKLREAIAPHTDELARQRLALVRTDPYGIEILEPWQKEMQRFASGVLSPVLGESIPKRHRAYALIEAAAAARAKEIRIQTPFHPTMRPVEYEILCAELLRGSGWETRTTQLSSDQGGDVIAWQGQTRVVLQCKLYSQPVGNKAVQEAFAAKAHYTATHAAVVTNASFTNSARALAASTGVLLLSQDGLQDLGKLIGLGKPDSIAPGP